MTAAKNQQTGSTRKRSVETDDLFDAKPLGIRAARRKEEQEIQDLCVAVKIGQAQIWQRLHPIAQRIAANYCKKYTWIDPEDLAQQMLLIVPEIIKRYDFDNTAGNSFSKYAYHRLYFEAKDCLREEDPLGIKWPQKKKYPEWHRLGDEGFSNFEVVAHESEVDERDEQDVEWIEYRDSARASLLKLKAEQITVLNKPSRESFDKAAAKFPSKTSCKSISKAERRRSIGLKYWMECRKSPKQMELFAC